ncbi:hypothetical protein CNY89_09610 [Amaricoccus sp. HAR-UPW-R2A-40]|nr:hypothetical protein CNY89_09610 [Amaricoccus sp. HAR-UPW-R2A-40]
MQPAEVQEGVPPPAGGEAEAGEIPGAPPAQSVIEGTVEPGAPPPAFVMPDLQVIGKPVPGGVNYQPAVTSVAEDTHWLSWWVHLVMAVIVLLVTALLAIVVVKFNRKSNPTPARFTHHTQLEIAWTLGPVLILILIGSFSLPILFKQLEIPEPDLTIKATGNQWYWNYEYPDNEQGVAGVGVEPFGVFGAEGLRVEPGHALGGDGAGVAGLGAGGVHDRGVLVRRHLVLAEQVEPRLGGAGQGQRPRDAVAQDRFRMLLSGDLGIAELERLVRQPVAGHRRVDPPEGDRPAAGRGQDHVALGGSGVPEIRGPGRFGGLRRSRPGGEDPGCEDEKADRISGHRRCPPVG